MLTPCRWILSLIWCIFTAVAFARHVLAATPGTLLDPTAHDVQLARRPAAIPTFLRPLIQPWPQKATWLMKHTSRCVAQMAGFLEPTEAVLVALGTVGNKYVVPAFDNDPSFGRRRIFNYFTHTTC